MSDTRTIQSKRQLEMSRAKVRNTDGGIRCPACGQAATRIFDSRPNVELTQVRRRRICIQADCGYRFTTYEMFEHPSRSAEIANIRTAHLDELVGKLKVAIEGYEDTRTHPLESKVQS